MSRQRHSFRQAARGIAIVEFTVMLPVLLLLLLGTAELGRALYEYNTLTKAVRDGARYLAENAEAGSTGVIDITPATATTTRNLVVYGAPATGARSLLRGFGTADVSVTEVDANHVRVAASYAYAPLFLAIPTFGNGGDIAVPVTFQAACTMRVL